MYMNPILFGGGLWPIHAAAHSHALGSMHIGSSPGDVGSSGMQVHPFVPLRKLRMLPSGAIATIVACPAIAAGAADMALAMSSLSDLGAGSAAPQESATLA